jgi:hypothetical protein
MMRRSLLNLACVVASGGLASRHLRAQQSAPAAAPYPQRTVISVADFGALPDGTDAAPGLRKAIAALPQDKPSALLFAPGDYSFGRDSDPLIVLNNFHDLIIDGQGAKWYFEGSTRPVWVTGSTGVQFRGIAIDWKRPPFSQGEVVAVLSGGLATEIRIDAEFPIVGDEPVRVQSIATYDRTARAMTIGGIDAINLVTKATVLRDQVLRLEFTRSLPLKTGDAVVLRHQMDGCNLFSFFQCSDIKLADLTISAAPGMAVIGVKCNNFAVENFRIAPTGARLMSTCLDGIHLASCTGRIDIANSSFEAMGDDAINVHAGYLQIERRVDSRAILLAHSGPASPNRVEWPLTGETVGFVDERSLLPLGSSAHRRDRDQLRHGPAFCRRPS